MRMCLRYLHTLVAGVFLLAYSGPASAAIEKPSLRSGKVVSVALNAHGSNAENNGMAGGRDIWWDYIISSGNQLYSVVSRENPSKTGLVVNTSFKFYEARDWMYIPNKKGKAIALKIQNKSKIENK
jgi:hypothetical protein